MTSATQQEKAGTSSAPAPTQGLVFTQLALGMIAFGSATPISKIVTGSMPVFVGSLFRVGLGALVLLPVVLVSGSALKRLSKTDWLHTGLIALFGMFGFTACMLYGMGMVSGVVGAIVMSTAPAVTAAGAMLFFGDSATWRKITAVVLAVAGVIVLHVSSGDGGSAGDSSTLLLGSLLVLGAVICEAVYTLLGKRVSEDVDPVTVAFLACLLSLPLFGALAAWQWDRFDSAEVSAGDWAAVGWYGAGTLALGTWLWYSGISKSQGSVAAGFMGLMPVSALVLSYLLLGEQFRWVHLLGFGIVFTGVLLVSWEHMRHGHRTSRGH